MGTKIHNPLAVSQQGTAVESRSDKGTIAGIHPSQVQEGLRFNGIEENGDPGISPSLTSNNNFINFCMTQNVPLTNGKQVEDGSCNPTPVGRRRKVALGVDSDLVSDGTDCG